MGFMDAMVQQSRGQSPMVEELTGTTIAPIRKPKRKLSAWQKYIKNKRNHIKYRDGKLNLKKMGVAFRRKKRR
jgi:hypothetical protein